MCYKTGVVKKTKAYVITRLLRFFLLQNRQGVFTIYYYRKDSPFLSGGPPLLLGSQCPPPEERRLSMP